MVNGNMYPVEQSGNGYSATLDGFTQTGKTEIKVEQVILENGKAFSLEKDHAVTVTIQKESPAITNLSVREEAEKGQFQVAFQLADPDGALSDRKIQIQNADGKLVGANFQINLQNFFYEYTDSFLACTVRFAGRSLFRMVFLPVSYTHL